MVPEQSVGKSYLESRNEIVSLLYKGLKARLKNVPDVKDIIVYLDSETWNIITFIKIDNTMFNINFDIIRKTDMTDQIILYMQDHSKANKYFVDKVAPYIKRYIYPDFKIDKDTRWTIEPSEDDIMNGFIGFEVSRFNDPSDWCCEYYENGVICKIPIKKTFYIYKGNVGCTFTKDISDNKRIMTQAMKALQDFMEFKKESNSIWLIRFTNYDNNFVTSFEETNKE